jgi:hypothetical protein
MSSMHISRKRTIAAALGVGALTCAVVAPSAMADTVESTVSGSNLTATTSGATLAGVTLDGTTQTTAAAASTSAWSIKDARGTGAAWAVSVTATTPTSAAGSVETTARAIAVGNLKMSTGTVTAGADSDPIANITGSTDLALATTSQTLISSSGTNKGTYSLTPTYTLTVPANAFRSNYAGAVGSTALNPYVSTLTFTIA